MKLYAVEVIKYDGDNMKTEILEGSKTVNLQKADSLADSERAKGVQTRVIVVCDTELAH